MTRCLSSRRCSPALCSGCTATCRRHARIIMINVFGTLLLAMPADGLTSHGEVTLASACQ